MNQTENKIEKNDVETSSPTIAEVSIDQGSHSQEERPKKSTYRSARPRRRRSSGRKGSGKVPAAKIADGDDSSAAVEEEAGADKVLVLERGLDDEEEIRPETEEIADDLDLDLPEGSHEALLEKPSGGFRERASQKGGAKAKEPTTHVRKLLINAEEPEECRIAVIESGRLEAFHVETLASERTKGDIYKGRIVAIEPSLQAAFVDIGTVKNGFLPFGESHPEYYYVEADPDAHWKDLKIQEVVRKGQEVLVQVVKEPTETKGANITTYLSLPGRYLVLMPGSDSAGVSRKIEEESQRQRLRHMMKDFQLPEGVGYILRTASSDITKTALSKDLKYLLRLWDEVKGRGQKLAVPALIYKDQDITSRFLRDYFTEEIDEIMVDNNDVYDQVVKFVNLLSTKSTVEVRLYQGTKPLFHQFNLEQQIEQIYQPRIFLPSGGSIVINPTEALVAIDVNSGRTSKDKDFEQSIFLANMEAATELARQLRLRDLGGLIVVDFIDMRDPRHSREVEKEVKNSMKGDKAKVSLSKISKFGLMQISRQKLGSPIQFRSYNMCEHCHGRGIVRSVESHCLFYLRQLKSSVSEGEVERIVCRLPMDVASYLLNKKRKELLEMEERYQVAIVVENAPEMNPSESKIDIFKRGH